VEDDYGCITDQFNVTTSSTLPVLLKSFDVKRVDDAVQLNWTIETDQTAEQFVIERSLNGRDFIILGSVAVLPGSGEQTYSYRDLQSIPGTVFYRLSVTGAAAAPAYFGIRKLNGISHTGFDLEMKTGMPGSLVLDCHTAADDQYSLAIYTSNGVKVIQQEIQLQNGTTRKIIDLKPGWYICELRNSRGEAVQQKAVVQ
jgi:hypothetical protein